MNRNKSVSSMNSQEGDGGLTQFGNKSIAPTNAPNTNTASALAVQSARSTSLLQSDRASLIRPMSAQSPTDAMKFKKREFSGGKAQQDLLENTHSDGDDLTLMNTQKQLIMPSYSAMDENQSLRKLKSTDMNDQLIVPGGQSTAATSNNGKKSMLTNNFMTPAGGAGANNNNRLNVSPQKMPQRDSTSNLGVPNALDQSAFSAQGPDINSANLAGTTSQHQVPMEVVDSDKELKSEAELRAHLTGHIGVTVSRIRLIGETMMKNLCSTIELYNIEHLRFEESRIHPKALLALQEHLMNRSKLKSIGLVSMKMEEQRDLKVLIEGIVKCASIRQVIFNDMNFYDYKLMESLKKLVQETPWIQELDISRCSFKSFKLYSEFLPCIANSKVWRLVIKETQIGPQECLVMKVFLNNCQSVRYLDISGSTGNPKNFDFIARLGVTASIRVLIMDEIDVDLSANMPEIGKAFGANMKMQTLSMKKNKKAVDDPNSSKSGSSWFDAQVQFWKALMPNRSIQVLHLEDMKINAQTCEQIALYLEQYNVQVTELNLQRNRIGKKGVKFLAQALRINNRLKILRLGHNGIGGEDGINELKEALSENDTLEELYLDQNNLENLGAGDLANFLVINSTLRVLDLSKNNIGSQGLERLSEKLASNQGLRTLFIGRNKDIIEESDDGIKALGNCLAVNQSLKVLDMDSVKISLPFQARFISENLKKNIFLQQFIIKKNKLNAQITEDLLDNEVIETKIINGRRLRQEGSILVLNLFNENPLLVRPAIKLIENLHILQVDFQEMDLSDQQIVLIANYLEKNLSLKRLNISVNGGITDYGMVRVAQALVKNDRLERLNFGLCSRLTIITLEQMMNLVRDLNITLWDISCGEAGGGTSQDKAQKLVQEAKWNENILHVLKPNPKINTWPVRVNEVKFNPQARISECFGSALKCWRIMKPKGIDVCDQGLKDPQISKLCELLQSDLFYQVERLTLRRNNIGDGGASDLSKFIARDPPCFIYLEISRNEITELGALEMLEALKKNTTLQTLLFEYGNLIKNPQLLSAIEKEIFANKLIASDVRNSLLPTMSTFGTLSINDKGPTYLRCAIKAIDIFNLIELNLSDNLLEYEQAVMLADMIKLNRNLKVLNLSKNSFSVNSARVISKALIYNEHLYHIDLSCNKLTDEGIALLVYPIAQQSLRRSMFETSPKAAKKPKGWLFDGEKQMNIKILNLAENDHEKESLKHVLALLYANKDIVIEIDTPKPLIPDGKTAEDMQKLYVTAAANTDGEIKQAPLVTRQGGGTVSAEEQKQKNEGTDESKAAEGKRNWRDLIGRFGPAIDYFRPQVSPRKLVHQIQTGPTIEEQRLIQKAEEEAKVNEAKAAKEAKKNKKKGGIAQRARANKKKAKNTVNPEGGESNHDLEGGKKEEDPESKKLKAEEQALILLEEEKKKKCCYRCREKCSKSDESKANSFFLKELRDKYVEEQRIARLFKCNEKILTEVENTSQQYISVWIYISTFLYYLTALLIPLTEEDSCKNGHDRNLFYYYAIYAIFSGAMEVALCFYIQKVVNDKKIFQVSKFHLWKVIGGQLARVDLLTDVLFLTQMRWCENYGIVAAGTIVLVLSGGYQFIMPFKLLKTDSGSLVRRIDRNCKLAYVTEHVGIAIILDSFSLSNFESINGKTVAIPKIISMIKCYTEDLPQFLIQVVYILFFSDKKNDKTGVVVSILLGLISFASSISTAISARSSDVALVEIMTFKEQRKIEKELQCEYDKKMFTEEGKERLTKEYHDKEFKMSEATNKNNDEKHLTGFRNNLQNLELQMSKSNKDGSLGGKLKEKQMARGKFSLSPSKKQMGADDMDISLISGGEANKSPDVSTTNLVQKPSNDNAQAQKKPRPDSAATSSSETTDKGNKKDLIMNDNKQLNIKGNLLPTNPGSSPTSTSKNGGGGGTNRS